MLRTIDDLKVSMKHRNQLFRAVERNSNQFAEKWIIPSFDQDCLADAIPHLFRNERSSFLHFDLDEMFEEHLSDDLSRSWAAIFNDSVLFTNPLIVGEYDPAKRVRGKHSGGTPPSERVRNGGWLVLTYEVDSRSIQELEMQLDWFAGKPDQCAFADVHNRLAGFADYRGYSAIFTGNKSVHINLIFDTRHLSKALLPDKARYRELWKQDVPDAVLPLLYSRVWNEVSTIIQQELGIQVEFDPLLSSYIQKRRSPWGLRTLHKGSELHGFDPDNQFCQIVLQERVAKKILAPKGAPAMFDMDKAVDLHEAVRCADRMPSANRVAPEQVDRTLDEFQSHLRRNGWSEYPKPVDLRFDGEHNIVFFQNDAADVHPSTVVRGDFRRLLPAGRGAPKLPTFLPNELTLDETLELLHSNHGGDVLRPDGAKQGRMPRVGKPLFSATDINTARNLSGPLFFDAASRPGPTLIQGPEGLGKTFALMTATSDLRIEDDLHLVENARPGKPFADLSRGFTGFACRSEAQLLEKVQEYRSLHYGQPPISLPSFSALYKQALSLTDTAKELSRSDAGIAGEPSLLHLIKAQQPDVFAEMERLRDDLWMKAGGRVVFQPDAVVFLVHGLLKVWPHAILTRAFLHPDCPSDLEPQKLKACADQMSFRRVIYDEVSVSDLVCILPSWKARLSFAASKACKAASGKPWDEAILTDRVRAYAAVMAVEPSSTAEEFDFDACDQIIRQKLRKKKDKVTVDVNLFPFGKGTSEKNIYRQADAREYYCKPFRWFWSLGCPVVVLTTEDLPRLIVRGMSKRLGAEIDKKFRVINMTDTPHLHRDQVALVFDERARTAREGKLSVSNLAKDLLASGFDYVISNALRPSDESWQGKVMSHDGARGRNDLVGKRVASILMYPSIDQYAELCVLGQAFGIEQPITVAYRDQIHQSLGRNLGFRYTVGQPSDAHTVIIKPSLFKDLDRLRGQSIPNGGSERYQFCLSDNVL